MGQKSNDFTLIRGIQVGQSIRLTPQTVGQEALVGRNSSMFDPLALQPIRPTSIH